MAPSTRMRTRLNPPTFYCGYKTLRLHTYLNLLRFRPSRCIRIRSEFDTEMLESLIEHALMNKLRRLLWQRSTWIGDVHTFTSSFSNVYGHMRPHVSGFVAFSLKSFHSGDRFQKFAVTVCVFVGYVWTESVTAIKCLRIQTVNLT